jgi:hypothetical protein
LGSDGGWVDICSNQGIEVAPLRPANCGFDVPWSEVFRTRFAGQPLKTIALSFAGRRVRGEAMVTDYGLEGGAVYALGATLRDAIALQGQAVLTIDLCPDLSQGAVAARLNKPRGARSSSSFLRKAAGLPPVAIGLLHEALGRTLPDDADRLAQLVKAVPIVLKAPRPLERAISTAGGIAFAELDDQLMLRSRPGVFVAGEMLDWEAPTGGYLLQACFATGVAAAQGLLGWLAQPLRLPSRPT